MPVCYHLDKEQDLLIGRGTGVIKANEIVAAFDNIMRETSGATFYKNHIFVIDKAASLHDLNWDGLTRIKESIEAWGKIYPGRKVNTALVVSDLMRGAIAKVWQAFADTHVSLGANVRLFEDEASAIDWLNS